MASVIDAEPNPAACRGCVVIRTMATPMAARVAAALLGSAGIPTHVDGDHAFTQMLIRTRGLQVYIPAALADRAETVLAGDDISDAELEAQALATPMPAAPQRRPATFRLKRVLLLLGLTAPAMCGLLVLRYGLR
jgi:hypothetical protein